MLSQPPRILIVDDEPQIARVLRTGLKTHGYEVRVAADGVSALETFGDWHPDLVVTDLAMPNMGGLDLCRRLRAITASIIVLSVARRKTKVEALTPSLTTRTNRSVWTSLLARCLANYGEHDASHYEAFHRLEVGDFLLAADPQGLCVRWKSI